MKFYVPNMICGHCVRTLTRAIHALDPKAQVEVDHATRHVHVASDVSSEQIVAALAAHDYPAAPVVGATPAAPARGGGGSCHG